MRRRSEFPRVNEKSFSEYRKGIRSRGTNNTDRTTIIDSPYGFRSRSGSSRSASEIVRGSVTTRSGSSSSRTSGIGESRRGATSSDFNVRPSVSSRSLSDLSADRSGSSPRGSVTSRSGGVGTSPRGGVSGRGAAGSGLSERGSTSDRGSSARGASQAPISRQARYGSGAYNPNPSGRRAGIGGLNRVDGGRLSTGIAERGDFAGNGGGNFNSNPYSFDYHNHRKSFFGFNDHFHHGWSFFAGFHFGHSFFSPFFYGYNPLFTYYHWYPYYNYGRSYYYSDYPYYASPSNNYYYDEYYPVYNYYGDGAVEGDASSYGIEPESPTSQTLVDFYLRLGDIHFKRGEYSDAVEAFKKAIQEDPGAAVPKFALGEALFATGDYHYAAYNIRKGLDIDPSWVEQTIDRRELYGNPDDFSVQIQMAMRYIEQHPFDTAASFVLGYNAFFSHALETAEIAFRKVQEIDSGDRYSKLFLDQIPSRKAALESEATEEAKKSTKKEPD